MQCVEAEIDFVESTYQLIKGHPARSLREDFCGTAQTACEWVQRHPSNTAIGVDLDPLVLQWGENNNLAALAPDQLQRIELLNDDVITASTQQLDVVLAMNFSYFIFMQRSQMIAYFSSVLEALNTDGVLFLDAFGGYEAAKELREERECDGFIYIWEQASFNPINSQMQCYIHFVLDDGTRMDKAFDYYWRLWTLPEITEMLIEAGFSSAEVYWEGTDAETGEGDGIYSKSEVGTADAGWVCYVVAEK
ncbi:class I SAM-dependent methyltransferase [Marinicella sp. S1101]|uniref:class I SAM-dependent methyltransferase n=1 Tax=Marinicella marina TaxID=2996016 RepID=UPI0024BC8E22|nr:class I SAM-dependent methyltransferase [Marinicella marina]MCX7554454.1 class I SAM-dependent methyltransferase [Marinicella marina]